MLDAKMREMKYKQSSVDMCLYYKLMNATIILVGIYVDDLLVTSNNVQLVDEFFQDMKAFDVKDLGLATKFLCIKKSMKLQHEPGNNDFEPDQAIWFEARQTRGYSYSRSRTLCR
jgi:hypothetical protein